MASNVKVDKITPTTNCGTVTLGDSGDTISIPSGASLSVGGTVSGIDGIVSWDTTAKTSAFTAVAGNGYFVNTTSAAITVTLPATPTAGDLVAVKDYAFTADTNNITLARNGSNIQGVANDFLINTEGRSVTLIYVDGTQGWLLTGASQKSDITDALYVTATGGTITTCGDYKLHVFTGPGTFTVSCAGNAQGSNSIATTIVAGGGGGGMDNGAGGGGGGLLAASTVPVSATGYPITVGAGGVGGKTAPGDPATTDATSGSNSVFSVFTSTGGGKGGSPGFTPGGPGGSGGGAGRGGATPGGSSTQADAPGYACSAFGNAGGSNTPERSGGGGGAGSAGQNSPSPTVGGDGGTGKDISPFHAGLTAPFFPNTAVYAGGGNAAQNPSNPTSGGAGRGYPYPGAPGQRGEAGTANTGGGGGGGGGSPPGRSGGDGGSGIVVISYKYQ